MLECGRNLGDVTGLVEILDNQCRKLSAEGNVEPVNLNDADRSAADGGGDDLKSLAIGAF